MKVIYKPVTQELREVIAEAERHNLSIQRIELTSAEWDALCEELSYAAFVLHASAPPLNDVLQFMGVRVVKVSQS